MDRRPQTALMLGGTGQSGVAAVESLACGCRCLQASDSSALHAGHSDCVCRADSRFGRRTVQPCAHDINPAGNRASPDMSCRHRHDSQGLNSPTTGAG